MPRAKGQRKSVPFPFLIEALEPLRPEVKSMFGGHAVYLGDRIVFMLRDRPKAPEDNGLWIVFSDDFDPKSGLRQLRREFPSLREIQLLEGKISHWLLIPFDGPDFETEALHACELLLARDPRIGRIPKSRQSRR